VEADNNTNLGEGMRVFGISFAKKINNFLGRVGKVY
jgi:hypothetical protein